MSRTKPADVRFYVDADLLGVAKVLAALRADVTYPGDPGGTVHKRTRPACVIADPHVKDIDWIPQVSARNWLILTRDLAIQAHKHELAAVRAHRARMVCFNTEQARGTFQQLEIFFCRWRDIESLADTPGPFVYVASRTSLRRVDLG